MPDPNNLLSGEPDDEGCVTAGRATGRPIPLPSDEDLRRAEEAWNDPAFYEFVRNLPDATAGPVSDSDRSPAGSVPRVPTKDNGRAADNGTPSPTEPTSTGN
jgi:hypothetical protein